MPPMPPYSVLAVLVEVGTGLGPTLEFYSLITGNSESEIE